MLIKRFLAVKLGPRATFGHEWKAALAARACHERRQLSHAHGLGSATQSACEGKEFCASWWRLVGSCGGWRNGKFGNDKSESKMMSGADRCSNSPLWHYHRTNAGEQLSEGVDPCLEQTPCFM